MEDKFIKLENVAAASWSDYTFVFPSVSVGNIGQLAVDLLISSLPGTKKAGCLISSLVQPLVGHDAFIQNSGELSLSCELYENSAARLVVLQLRAPLFKGKRSQFVQLLVDFIRQEKFRETVCVTSSHAYERVDSQLTGAQLRFLTTARSAKPANAEWKALEKRVVDQNCNVLAGDERPEKEEDLAFIPGGGIASKFFKASKEAGLSVLVLIVFAHEGNNIPEAFQLVNYLNEWKTYLDKSSSWRIPISWKYVFGQTMDPSTQSQIF